MKPILDRKDFEEIYALLDKSGPIDSDCGKLCGCACCMSEENETETGLYLLPGEESMFTLEEDWIDWDWLDVKEYDFPESWDGKIPFFQCKTPPACPRKNRPVQCRTFPLAPHLKDGILYLIYNNDNLPYSCPLVDKKVMYPLNEDFIRNTYRAWKRLLKDPLIFDLIKLDSDYRTAQGWPVETVYPKSNTLR